MTEASRKANNSSTHVRIDFMTIVLGVGGGLLGGEAAAARWAELMRTLSHYVNMPHAAVLSKHNDGTFVLVRGPASPQNRHN